jgi:hypothetical protein
MVSISTEKLQQIVASVADWPAPDRVLLARKILETVDPISSADSDRLIGESPGSGFLRTEGALANDDQWDAIMAEIHQSRGTDSRSVAAELE